MTATPVLDRITIHPIKSLDGQDVASAVVAEGGCLLHDRAWALQDDTGEMVIGKTDAGVHTLRTRMDLEQGILSIRLEGERSWTTFAMDRDLPALEAYFSRHFGRPITVLRNDTGRFLDIPDKSGATVLATSSLQQVARWFHGMDLESSRRRFRANLELAGAPPFWEDNLFADEDHAVEFTIGAVTFLGMSPRARCVVPTRDPASGETTSLFPRTFATWRLQDLPSWSRLREQSHGYFLSVDCLLPATEVGKTLHVGDPVTVVGTRRLERVRNE